MTQQFIRICFILLTTFSVSNASLAQKHKYSMRPIGEGFDCVMVDSAYLYFPGDREDFKEFYNKLQTLIEKGTGQVNILHLGDSHIQAGVVSSQLRANLSNITDSISDTHTMGAGRGIIFPFKTLKSNGPSDYSIATAGLWQGVKNISKNNDAILGITGAAAITTDPDAELILNLSNKEWAFSELRVLGYASESGVFPIIISDKDTILPDKNDELCGFLFHMPRETQSCVVRFKGVGRERGFTLRGLMPYSNRSGIVYTEAGINGATVKSWLKCTEFWTELGLIKPDLLIVALGTNDASCSPNSFKPNTFLENYYALIDQALQVNPKIAIMFVTNSDCYQSLREHVTNKNTPQVVELFKQLATDYNGCVFNLFETMGGLGTHYTWVSQKLMNPDHVHFSSTGYKLIGDLIYNALIRDFSEYTKTSK